MLFTYVCHRFITEKLYCERRDRHIYHVKSKFIMLRADTSSHSQVHLPPLSGTSWLQYAHRGNKLYAAGVSTFWYIMSHYFLICLISPCFIPFLSLSFLLSVSVRTTDFINSFSSVSVHSSITRGWRITGLEGHPCIIFTETVVL